MNSSNSKLRFSETQESRVGGLFESWIQDLGFGARLLRKNPGFTFILLSILAVGIGANSAVFSLVDTILLQPLPYVHPEELMLVSESVPQLGGGEVGVVGVAAGEYLDYRDRNRSFAQVAAYQNDGFNLTGPGTPLRINADRATPSLFPLLGVHPVLGRTFNEDEGLPGAGSVVVLSYDLWQRQYGGDSSVLGKTVKLDEKPHTVIGVMPPSFHFPTDSVRSAERVELWVPLSFTQDQITDRLREFGINFVGRLKPGIGQAQAEQDIKSIAQGFMRERPDVYSGTLHVVPHTFPYSAQTAAKTRPLLILFSATVACVLLIACANVASLLLARANRRKGEMAIRAAVGASHSRLIRQCLAESSLLGLLGGVAGIGLAAGLLLAIKKFGPANLGRLQDATLNPVVLVFTVVVSLATSVILGFFPARRLSRTSPQSCIKETSHVVGDRSNKLLRRLTVVEIAAALVLLIGGSLLVESFVRVLNVPFGFDPHRVVLLRTIFDRPRYPDPLKREAVQKELLNRFSRLPGVVSVALASHLPLSDARQIGFRLEHDPADQYHWAENSLVSPGYFRAMGISLLHGRDFNEADIREVRPAAIINETFAKQFLGSQDPIGQRFYWGDRGLFTIIGVANDVHISALDADPPAMIYQSMFQVESGGSSRSAFVIRLSGSNSIVDTGIFSALQQQVWAVDKDLPTYDSGTMDELVSASLAQRRFTTLLMGGFALVALLLASVGLFGVVSYIVSERRREFAVRVALGAERATIFQMVLWQGALMAALGCAGGLAVFVLVARLLRSNLYQLSALDPNTLILAPVMLFLIALLASYWPALQAMRSDPMEALRYE